MELIGRLVEKMDVIVVSDRFRRRDFVIEIINQRNPQYNDLILFQLTNDNCERIDNIQIGEEIQVTFDIRGRKWTSPEGRVSYFNTLSAWRVDRYQIANQPMQGYQQPMQSYQPPMQGYQQPMQGYQQPMQSYQPPMQGYSQQPATPATAPMSDTITQSSPAPEVDNGDDLPF